MFVSSWPIISHSSPCSRFRQGAIRRAHAQSLKEIVMVPVPCFWNMTKAPQAGQGTGLTMTPWRHRRCTKPSWSRYTRALMSIVFDTSSGCLAQGAPGAAGSCGRVPRPCRRPGHRCR